MFFAISLSGNPLLIYSGSKFIYVVSAAAMFGLCYVKGKKLLNSKLIFWIISSCILFIFQNSNLKYTSVPAEISFLARIYIAFLTAMFFGYRFREIYLRVMVAICFISIPFYLLDSAGINFGYRIDRYNSVLFYNFMNIGRNPGMFWEPGAFQGFIILIPLLYSDKLKQLWNKYKKACVILLIALLTTQSTTGYLTFAGFIFLTTLLNGKMNIVIKGGLIASFIVALTYVWKQDFMGEKIANEIEIAQTIESGEVSWSRMGTMMIDIENISRQPLIGNGFVIEERYGILADSMAGAGNGFSGAINMFGIPFMILYFIGIFKNLTSIPKPNRLIFILAVIMMLYGEYFLNSPFFWSLLFIKFPISKNGKQSICYNLLNK